MRVAASGTRWRRHAAGYAFVGPALLVLAAFLVYPIGYSVWLSLHEWDGYTPRWGPFVGLENYRALAGDEVFWGRRSTPSSSSSCERRSRSGSASCWPCC